MPWWTWVIAGLLSLCAEIFIPLDFYLFFLGIAAILTGVLTYAEFLPEAWMQWATCGIIALALLLSVRRKLLDSIHASGTERPPEFEGELVAILETIEPGAQGKGEARGSNWTVINRSTSTLESGKSYPVTRVEGLSLVIEG